MPTVIVVLDSRRVSRALRLEAHELDGVRVRVQAWLDERSWALDVEVRDLGVRSCGDGEGIRSVVWEVRGPADHVCEATGWIAPGEAWLVDAEGKRWRLSPERVETMGIRRNMLLAIGRQRVAACTGTP